MRLVPNSRELASHLISLSPSNPILIQTRKFLGDAPSKGANNPSPFEQLRTYTELINMARIEAQDLFEVKVDIIRAMDPTGDWMGRGPSIIREPLVGRNKLFNLRHDLQ